MTDGKKSLVQRIKENKIAAAEKSIINITNEGGFSILVKFILTHWVTVLTLLGLFTTFGYIKYQQEQIAEYQTQVVLNNMQDELENFQASTKELEAKINELKFKIQNRDKYIKQLQAQVSNFTPEEKGEYIRKQIDSLKEKRGLTRNYSFMNNFDILPLPNIPGISNDEQI